MYCKLHDSSKHNFEDCNMFHQIVKSTIDKGRLKFVETPKDDQSILIGPNGRKFLYRLLQADPFKVKVKTAGEGSSFQVKKLLKSIMNIILRAKIPSKLRWRRQGLRGSKQIQ